MCKKSKLMIKPHSSHSSKTSLTQSLGLMPQEEKLEIRQEQKKLFIGLPKEVEYQENRIALVPETVAMLVGQGHNIYVERDAGQSACFSDKEYSEAGARIVENKKELYKAELILKIAPPGLEELELMYPSQTIISALHLAIRKRQYFEKIIQKRLQCVAFEYIKEQKTGIFPILRSMSEIAGNTAILVAAEYLSNINNGKGLMLGGVAGVKPTSVVILGAGTVGEFAVRSAMGLGAEVKVFDNSLEKLRNLQNNLNTRIYTSILQPKVLEKSLMRADVVIGALHYYDKNVPCIITENMVSQMKKNSIIIDLSIDRGGIFETSKLTSHSKPIFKKHDVIHYCVPNINSRVSRTASYALSNIFSTVLQNISINGGIKSHIKHDLGFRNGIYAFNGYISKTHIAEKYILPYKDLDLLISAF